MGRGAAPGEMREGRDTLLTLGFNDRRVAYQCHALKTSIIVTTSVEQSPVKGTDDAVIRDKARHVYGMDRTDSEKPQSLGFVFLCKRKYRIGGCYLWRGDRSKIGFPLR